MKNRLPLLAALLVGVAALIASGTALAIHTTRDSGITVQWAAGAQQNGTNNGLCEQIGNSDDLHPSPGQQGWIFILNQVNSNTGWTLTATFSDGTQSGIAPISTENQNVHFAVYTSIGAQLVSASASNSDGTAGDSKTNLVVSHCTVNKPVAVAPTLTTSIHDNTSGHDGVTSAALGDTVHDTATVSGGAQGTVSFTWFTNATCAPTGSAAGSAGVNGSGLADGSTAEGPLAPGDYSFSAHFTSSDTTKWTNADSGCEPLQVAAPIAGDLTGTKDANPSFQRNFTWTIAKSVDKTTQNISGGTATFNYTITVTKSAPSDSGWNVAGTINVSNPDALSVSGVNITDAINDGASHCTVSGGSGATLAPASITPFAYSCSYSGAPSSQTETNTATITWPDQVIAGFTWLHGSSAPATAAVNWGGAAVTVVNDSITVSDSQGGSFGPTSQTASFNYSKSFGSAPGTCSTYPNTATIDQTSQQSSQSVQVCAGADLIVSKTATPSYTRTFKWNVTKAVDHNTINTSGAATANYTVNVTHDGGTDSGWQVTGSIHVANPNTWEAVTASVTDAIDNGGSCAVTGGTAVSVPAGSSVDLPYTCTYASAPSPAAFTNTATATWDATVASTPDGAKSGSASGAFDAPTTTVDGSVNVIDSIKGALGTVSSTDPSPTTFTYPLTFNDPAGTCTTHTNIVTIGAGDTELGRDSQNVKVCVGADLVVGKTAQPSFTRTFTWGISKAVDKSQINTSGPATANYAVNVTHDAGVDSGWQVTGNITVANPNDWEPVALTGLADAIDNGGTCSISGDTSSALAAGQVRTLSYTCSYASAPSAAAFTNTATATWDAAAASTPDGSKSGSASGAFGAPTTIVDGSAVVTDTLGGTLGTVSSTDASPKTFAYSVTFNDQAGTCTTHNNTAMFTASDTHTTGSASANVKVCVGADLTVTKTVTPSFTRTFKWGIAKNVDKTTVTLIGGGTATFNYTVSVTHDGGTDSNLQANGSITISNPNDWEPVTLSGVVDSIDHGGSCSITSGNPTAAIPAGGSVILGYSCTFASNPGSGTNTATASWDTTAASTPDGSKNGTANYTFGSPTSIVDGSVNVTDTFGGTLGTVSSTDSSPKTFTYSHGFPAPPAGSCVPYNNTAVFTTVTSQTTGRDSKTVTVCDYNAALTPGYWKNHLSQGFQLLPSPTLGNFTVGTQSIATAIFNAMNCSSSSAQDAIGCLAGHLLATEFNLANHSDICINTTVAKAKAFLSGGSADGVTGITYTGPSGTYSLSTAQRNEAIALKSAFDKYNNGGGC